MYVVVSLVSRLAVRARHRCTSARAGDSSAAWQEAKAKAKGFSLHDYSTACTI